MSSRSSASSIEALSFQVCGLAYQISQSLKDHEKADANQDVWTTADEATKAVRSQLLNSLRDLQDAITGPSDRLRELAITWTSPSALRWIVHFKVADYIPDSGSISYADLATAAKVPQDQLKRVARFVMTDGLFTEPQLGHIAHTAMSKGLRTEHPLHDWVAHCLELSLPVAGKMAEATEKYGETDAADKTAFNIAYDTPLPLFTWLKGHSEHAGRFGRLMHALHASAGYDVKHLIDGYPWNELGKAKVVEMGGGLGHASVALAKAFPQLHAVVQDLDYVVKDISIPEELRGQLEAVPHDLFEEQTIKDADVYLLRQVLHNWPDESSVKILKNIIPALKQGARILIMDQVAPAPGQLPRLEEQAARNLDLVMMSHFNAKERDLEDWKNLLTETDSRLKLKELRQPKGSVLTLIEVVLDDTNVNGHHEANRTVEDGNTNGVH